MIEYIVPIAGFTGLAFAAYLARYVLNQDKGTQKMQDIANAIAEGANAFLHRQYSTIGKLAVIVAAILAAVWYIAAPENKGAAAFKVGFAFLTGAAMSAISGYVGMYISVRSNVRAAAAARKSASDALTVALRGGAVTGLLIVCLSVLGVAGIYYLYSALFGLGKDTPLYIVGYGFGASFVALFAQLGGGIYTKAADVGADLVGKIEAGIPEDDPRNPAVIADLVGDNVGDCAGRGADLFESTAAENIGAMILGILLFPIAGFAGILFPLVARALGIFATIAGLFSVKMKEDEDPMKALARGYVITSILAAIFFYIAVKIMFAPTIPGHMWLFASGLVGIAMSVVFLYLTDYYTSDKYRPVQEIAESSQTGPATNIISGLAVSMETTALPAITICASLLLAFYFGGKSGVAHGGLYGTALATMGMLATCAYILAMDTFGPITDNANGIIEMSGFSGEVRKVTDKLDAVGNTTKALTKGYAVGSAGLAAFLLFQAYMEAVHINIVDIAKPDVFVGGFVGVMLVFIFSSLAIRAVGRNAYVIINEVRRQFREIPGIMEGKAKADYAACVDICTRGALKEMVLPGMLPVLGPVLIGVSFKYAYGSGGEAVASFLMMGTIGGVILAMMMNNGGGAWDNAKKYIEAGAYGGKRLADGSKNPTHAAAVVGDTVGDPLKDTAGPSLHVVIKLLSTITLVLAPLFV
ncbi:MAG: sodium-translocating pyrophosphatase [Euryarchaeota archaeon]|nr:sodium-translocating pyrophosphatase [Euryarchaeota archaeon]